MTTEEDVTFVNETECLVKIGGKPDEVQHEVETGEEQHQLVLGSNQ